MKAGIKFIFTMLCFYAADMTAQNLYTIKLKSGIVLKCEVVKMVPDSFILIKQYDRVDSLFMNQVETINYSENKASNALSAVSKPVRKKIAWRNLPDSTWQYGFRLGLGLVINIGNYDYLMLPFNTYRYSAIKGINQRTELGFNVCFEPMYDIFWEEGTFLVGAAGELRYGLVEGKPRRPFVFAEAGYGFNVANQSFFQGGGPKGGLGLGYSSRTKSQNCVFSVMLGCKLQYLQLQGYERFGSQWSTKMYNEPMAGAELSIEWRF